MTEVMAVVPMRHNSERVRGKNYRPLDGRPLYHHVIKSLLDVDLIDYVVVDTDSELIREDAAIHFPNVRVVERPSHLQDGAIPMTEVLLNTLESFQPDIVLQTHSTNPFVRPATFRSAIETFTQAEDIDSVFSVTPMQARIWSSQGVPLNHDPAELLRTQDLEPIMIENSCFYVFTPRLLKETGQRIGPRARMLTLTPTEAVDIDTEDDFHLAAVMAASRETRA